MSYQRPMLRLLACLGILLLSSLAYAADYNVDCSNQNAPYNSINAVVSFLQAGDQIFVSGTCTENVVFNQLDRISLLASPTASLAGSLSITQSSTIYVYGMNITSPAGDGIYIGTSRDVIFDSCTSNGNAGSGLVAESAFDVYILNGGSFSNNGNSGISATEDSTVWFYSFGGPVDVSNNVSAGVYASGANVTSYGNLTITGNKAVPGSLAVSGYGIDFRGASRGQFGSIFGNNVIANNETGGVSLQENSEISFWGGILLGNPDALNVIQNNGASGVVVAFGSQATFFEGIRILGHSDVGVDVYAKSQAYFSGDNKIQGNGTGPYPARAGLRVDGNSEAFLRGGQITQNGGPGILALVNSSVDFASLYFGQNSGGGIVCDSSAYMVSDLTNSQANLPLGLGCRTPHIFGPHRIYKMGTPHLPNWRPQKAKHDFYRKLIADHQKNVQP